METQLYVLNAGCGSMEGNLWSKVQILDDEVFIVNDGERLDKGVKPAKLNVDTSNNNALGKKLHNLNLPATLTVTLKSSVKGGEVSMKIVDFKLPTDK